MFEQHNEKVKLLIQVLPFIAQEQCFALHGGTAINLFVRDLPRVSVDIDLTYLPVEDRETSIININHALERIKAQIEKRIRSSKVILRADSGKLFIKQNRIDIKLEVNPVKRGALSEPKVMSLCEKARSTYEAFASVPVVHFGQLYGGKICAALDRQHPRDLFDIKLLLENEGFTGEIRTGLILGLVSSGRPINELITPNYLDQKLALDNQFAGMTDIPFTYFDFESTRENLVKAINKSLTREDKDFLLSVKRCEPNWSIYDFKRFPAVQWKLQNLKTLKTTDPDKHKVLYRALDDKLK